jgi:hypothetical protein
MIRRFVNVAFVDHISRTFITLSIQITGMRKMIWTIVLILLVQEQVLFTKFYFVFE